MYTTLELGWGWRDVPGHGISGPCSPSDSRKANCKKHASVNLRLALREAELRALEAQINPHFLFNCLNSIRALVAENPSRAQDMITRLANIFRYNLHRAPTHTVPLAAEVEGGRRLPRTGIGKV